MAEPFVIIPLLNGLIFAIAAMCTKRSTSAGVGPWRTTFAMNVVLGIFSLPFWFLGEPVGDLTDLLGPLIVSVCFFAAQLFGIFAIHKGDVSVVTPILGVKAVAVGLLSIVIVRESQTGGVLAGAALSAVAIFLIRGNSHAERKRLAPSIILGVACAFTFALCDVLVQLYGGTLGYEKLVAASFTFVMIWSIGLVPFFHGSMKDVDRVTWRWLIFGSSLMAIQAILMGYVLSEYGKATIVNVMYSSRGLWSVLLVWMIGHWFGNREQELGTGAMLRRFAGALTLIVAIFLAMP